MFCGVGCGFFFFLFGCPRPMSSVVWGRLDRGVWIVFLEASPSRFGGPWGITGFRVPVVWGRFCCVPCTFVLFVPRMWGGFGGWLSGTSFSPFFPGSTGGFLIGFPCASQNRLVRRCRVLFLSGSAMSRGPKARITRPVCLK